MIFIPARGLIYILTNSSLTRILIHNAFETDDGNYFCVPTARSRQHEVYSMVIGYYALMLPTLSTTAGHRFSRHYKH